MKPIAVLGAGAFGTALAAVMATGGRPVYLWGRSSGAIEAMVDARENAQRLPGVRLPDNLVPIASLSEIPPDAVQILALPAQMTEAFLEGSGALLPRAPLVLAAKGLGAEGGRTQAEIVGAQLPMHPLAVLSGPGFAGEIARGLPTALTLACADKVLASQLQERLSAPTLRLYTNEDMLGVQLGGALKNVVALACGMCAGAGLGESARAALMTRGFAEMRRLAQAMGALPETMTGLSGLGDLALSAATRQSRNFAAGYDLAARGGRDEGQTVEGIATAGATMRLAERYGVEAPIASAVEAVVSGDLGVPEAMERLLSRPQRAEGD